jgi:DHA3 family macrolide efflux protein-like MFS transporter
VASARGGPSAAPSALAVFRNRNFTALWTGQLVSTIGSALTSLAASILVFRETGSALSVGLMLMATAAPSLLIGLIAGVFVDRLDRKRILIAADLIRGVLVVFIPFLFRIDIAWLYIIVMLTSAVGQFYDPAHESVLPEVASDEDLAAANSFMAISSFGSTAIGFAASGLIASRYPIEWAFYLDGLSFAFSAACILLVRVPSIEVEGRTSIATVALNLKSGARFLFETPILRSLLLVSLPVYISFGLWNSLLLPFALRALHATEFEYGLQEALTSVGFVIGSLIMARLADRYREGEWITYSFIGMGLVGAAYAATISIPLAIVLVMISGLLNAPASIARRLIVQRNAPREVRGRVNSAFFVTRDVVFLIGMAAAGLADLYGVRLLVLISALLLVISGALTLAMPGLGRPGASWLQALGLLRRAALPSQIGYRPALAADLDLLAGHWPAIAGLAADDRRALLADAHVKDVAQGATILHHEAPGDEAYFILKGHAVAGLAAPEGNYRSLSSLSSGDIFGEIAALTGSHRTANVVADEPTTLLEIPAATLRGLMAVPAISQIVLSKMSERLGRTHAADLPRLASLDQQALQELRTPTEPLEAKPDRAGANQPSDEGGPKELAP